MGGFVIDEEHGANNLSLLSHHTDPQDYSPARVHPSMFPVSNPLAQNQSFLGAALCAQHMDVFVVSPHGSAYHSDPCAEAHIEVKGLTCSVCQPELWLVVAAGRRV